MELNTTYLFFVGDIEIPNSQPTKPSGERLGHFISKYETKMLKDVLGYELYSLLDANSTQGSGIYHDLINGKDFTDSLGRSNRWVGFKTIGSSMLANFIYFNYMGNRETVSTGVGEKMPQAENMANASSEIKMITAWNEMVDIVSVLHDFLVQSKADYPTYIGLESMYYGNYNYFIKKNIFGL